MAGPKITFPISLAEDQDKAAFFNAVYQIVYAVSQNGPTASRPTSSSQRFIGMPYFDTTLGLPVFLKTASSSAWVKADGTAA